LLGLGWVRNLWKPTFSKENPFFIAGGSSGTGVKKNGRRRELEKATGHRVSMGLCWDSITFGVQ
jgi:hypothetical protein